MAKEIRKQHRVTDVSQLSEANRKALADFEQHLKLKSYSASTRKTYCNEFRQLLVLLKKKPVWDLTEEDLKRYLVYAMEKEGIGEHTAHSRINALKYYFEKVLGGSGFLLTYRGRKSRWDFLRSCRRKN
jgi:integrase/recombinase XerD